MYENSQLKWLITRNSNDHEGHPKPSKMAPFDMPCITNVLFQLYLSYKRRCIDCYFQHVFADKGGLNF